MTAKLEAQIGVPHSPGETVTNVLTKKELIVNKTAIDFYDVVSYLCWDGTEFLWMEGWQIKKVATEVAPIGFNT